ncbi:MAG: T9SS type A sorting domain-containing protein [Bacteroidales bacterium]|nr:T9SS type A sorting domain-containing protein [Bacteroidales bacterium]MCF8343131.1 T9SS type A sorting domain-containing protein [Bacteroidales bacterium]MCF8351269.1 T9SS type A sorting domain-containing protein [Bacteroidales bacterium]MCF8376099.1 T9SS type A sorting domain-containing protein [Bacteroidales bacterium]MCF8400368.1 T9SS type A sorting domain-containing protein [Bacteroidales bacterium]
MKKLYFTISVIAVPLALVLYGYSTGSPGGKTGSPGDDGSTCTDCHSGTTTAQSGWITTDVPASGYLEGETYTITATGTHEAVVLFGFELTAENDMGNKFADFTLVNSDETKFTNANQAVTHSSGGTTPNGNSRTWNVEWTAPSGSEGEITFYAAFNAANGNGNNTGDVIYTSETTVSPNTVGIEELLAQSVAVYPNPADHVLNIGFDGDFRAHQAVVFNQAGQQVRNFYLNGSTQLDVSGLEQGLYFVRLSNQEQSTVKKLLKR